MREREVFIYSWGLVSSCFVKIFLKYGEVGLRCYSYLEICYWDKERIFFFCIYIFGFRVGGFFFRFFMFLEF